MMIFLTTIILQETLVACLFSIHFCERYCTLSGGLYQNAVLHIHIDFHHQKAMFLCVLRQHGFLRRDLSRSVFAKQCAIRIDKQQKERYNNVVIDNDVII